MIREDRGVELRLGRPRGGNANRRMYLLRRQRIDMRVLEGMRLADHRLLQPRRPKHRQPQHRTTPNHPTALPLHATEATVHRHRHADHPDSARPHLPVLELRVAALLVPMLLRHLPHSAHLLALTHPIGRVAASSVLLLLGSDAMVRHQPIAEDIHSGAQGETPTRTTTTKRREDMRDHLRTKTRPTRPSTRTLTI